MKKLISFLLVIMMLCSMSVSAFADNMTVDVSDAAKFDVATTNDSATQKTDLWLQVEASGQIDVTVPLVMVFKTNIDGGDATEATNYKISNNNNANLAVTSITVEENSSDTIDLITYNANKTFSKEDQYMVKMTVAATSGTTKEFDLSNMPKDVAASEGGHFQLDKADRVTDTDGTDTVITVDMATSPLTFVTKTDDSTNKYGVNLLTVTYTVAINTKGQIEIAISGDGEGGYTYTGTTVKAPTSGT